MRVGATHQWCHCLQLGVVAADHDGYAARESPVSKGWQRSATGSSMPQAEQRRMQKAHTGLYSYLKSYQGKRLKRELHILQIREYQLPGQNTGPW